MHHQWVIILTTWGPQVPDFQFWRRQCCDSAGKIRITCPNLSLETEGIKARFLCSFHWNPDGSKIERQTTKTWSTPRKKKNGESKHALKRKQNQTKHVLRSWWNLFLSRKTELRNYEGQTWYIWILKLGCNQRIKKSKMLTDRLNA